MSKTKRILRVFISSPSDLVEEREAAEEVVNEVNLIVGDSLNVRLELIRWEKNVRPGLGADAQDVINKQIGDDYEIFVGMMWGRFGSATNRAGSGTEEEFNRALARWKDNANSVEIMFYFKDAAIPPSQIDPLQLAKVQEFRRRLASDHGGLALSLLNVDDFKSKLRMHLSSVAREKANSLGTDVTTPIAPTISNAVLKHFSSLTDDDYDEGIIDLSDLAQDALRDLGPTMDRISAATNRLGNSMRSRTSDLEIAKSTGASVNREDAKRIANATADDIEIFVGELAAVVPEYQLKQMRAFDLFRKVVVISNADFKESTEDVSQVLSNIQTLKKTMSVTASHILSFRDTIASLPRMTTAFNRARRRAVALLDDLIGEIQSGLVSAGDIERLLLQRLGRSGVDA